MKKIKLKDLVRDALHAEWPAFAEDHPQLAAVLAEDVLIEPVASALADNREYMESFREAVAVGIGIQTIQDLVRDWTREWLDRLL